MNLHQSPSARGGLHRIVRMLSLLLLQHALTPSIIDAHVRSRLPSKLGDNPTSDGESLPYLKVTGALPLRFNAAPPPPDLTSKPPVSAQLPPPPVAAAVSAAPAQAAPANKPENKSNDSTASQPATVISNSPSTILPDDTRPSTRPEDFLPYFQFPGGDVNNPGSATAPRPPVPGQLPPSSATYQQK